MTTEIRHTVKALKLVQNAKSVSTSREAMALIAEAQVHATLALVEAQRLANLITIYDSGSEAEAGYADKNVRFHLIADQIKEGLGL